MHDIDAQISKISGQENYMEQLSKITGNIEQIDMEMYHEKHTKMVNCDTNIKILLNKIKSETDSIDNYRNTYEKESSALNIKEKTFGFKEKKKSKKSADEPEKPPQEIVMNGYRPMDLVKTEWFKCVKHMEKDINKFLIEIFPVNEESKDTYDKDVSTKTFPELEAEYKKHPELRDIKTALDCKVDSPVIFTSLLLLKRYCKIIINILLMPMYDVKKTINSHWTQIDKIFKTKAFQQTQIASPTDIVNILHQFIIAKYRATITGNNKHYVKLFLNTVGSENISNMDGARFMEIMDAIDLDKLDKKDKVYKFALGAKTAMEKIAANENITPDILKEFDTMFDDDKDGKDGKDEGGESKEKKDENTSPEATCTDHADILA